MNTFAPFQAQETARAKVNLSLEILARRPDGYHELVSLMANTGLADQLFFSLKPAQKALNRLAGGHGFGWRVASSEEGMPEGAANICHKAARLFFEQAGIKPWTLDFEARIVKRIPLEAGLGGGSADAAAVLRFLWQCWQEGLAEAYGLECDGMTRADLATVALRCGADVPFCLAGGIRLCGGVGERLSDPFASPAWPLLIAKPPDSVSTAEAFQLLDQEREGRLSLEGKEAAQPPPAVASWKEALGKGDRVATAALIKNDFLEIIARKIQLVRYILEELKASGAFAVSMTGSGPSCFALYEDEVGLERAYEGLTEALPGVKWLKTALSPEPESFPVKTDRYPTRL